MAIIELGTSVHYDNSGKSLYYHQEVTHHKTLGTNRSKALRLGTVEDIKLEFPSLPFSGLKEYIRLDWGPRNVPVYVFDDHNHALFGWFEAFKEGRLAAGATLLHFDSDSDSVAASGEIELQDPLEYIARYARGLEIGEFIEPAERCGLVAPSNWIYEKTTFGMTPSQIVTYPLKSLNSYHHGIEQAASYISNRSFNPEGLIVNADADFFPWVESTRDAYGLSVIRQAMSVAGVVTIATSPGYIPPQRALHLVQALLAP